MHKPTLKFGTSGWRAILSDEFTFANVARLLDAITLFLREQTGPSPTVVIGSDTRFLSDKFRQFAAQRLAHHGVNCLVTNRDCPTPVISFVIRNRHLAGGINFTASHNPPEYQGLKFNPADGAPANSNVTSRIESLIDAPVPPATASGSVSSLDPREDYFSALFSHLDPDALRSARLRVACDVLYGTGRDYLDEALRRLGAHVTVLHDWLNPLFGGRRPEPAPDNLEELIQIVKDQQLDLGLATDGDADRFGVVDKGGRFFNANQVLCLTAWHLHKNRRRRGRIIRSVATTGYLDRIAHYLATDIVEVPVGFKYIGPEIIAGNVLVGGEESGGLSIGGHVPEKDGILACLLIAELVAMERKTLADIWRDIESAIGTLWSTRVDLTLSEDDKQRLLAWLRQAPRDSFLGRPVKAFNGIDGFKFTFNDTDWVLIRPSGTEPIIRCYIESDNAAHGETLKADLLRELHSHVTSHSHSDTRHPSSP
ncbi:MAG: phosphoglucomutase/phosphomannomutase family protein [bacterium]|nr:phosphoglucomutase/phosphomannomutase family protein [bacterium]